MTAFMRAFPKKSRSRRRKIFVQRARKTIRPVVQSFYEKTGARIERGDIDILTNQIVADIVDTVDGNEAFVTTVLRPEIGDQTALLEALHTAVLQDDSAGMVAFSKTAVDEAVKKIAAKHGRQGPKATQQHASPSRGGRKEAAKESAKDAEKVA